VISIIHLPGPPRYEQLVGPAPGTVRNGGQTWGKTLGAGFRKAASTEKKKKKRLPRPPGWKKNPGSYTIRRPASDAALLHAAAATACDSRPRGTTNIISTRSFGARMPRHVRSSDGLQIRDYEALESAASAGLVQKQRERNCCS